MIAAAGVVSYALNPAAKIALASLVAFGSAAVASAIVFQLARRFPILARANGANVAGAAVDSIVFPLIAFGAVFPTIAALQFVAKVAGGALWSWVVLETLERLRRGSRAMWLIGDDERCPAIADYAFDGRSSTRRYQPVSASARGVSMQTVERLIQRPVRSGRRAISYPKNQRRTSHIVTMPTITPAPISAR